MTGEPISDPAPRDAHRCGTGQAPFSTEAFAAIRFHPEFRAAVLALAAGNLTNYRDLTPTQRWLTSDLGRAALTGAAMVLDAMLGGFPPSLLIQSALTNRTCSEGRARHYVRTATAHGYLETMADGRLRVSARMLDVMRRGAAILLRTVATLDPSLTPTVGRLEDPDFQRRFAMQVGLNIAARPDLFNGPDMPIVLFLGRDGGMRVLEQLLTAPGDSGGDLLAGVQISQSALAKGAFVSRSHVGRLLADGESLGLIRAVAPRFEAAPQLSDDIARHYALIFEMARVSAHAALA